MEPLRATSDAISIDPLRPRRGCCRTVATSESISIEHLLAFGGSCWPGGVKTWQSEAEIPESDLAKTRPPCAPGVTGEALEPEELVVRAKLFSLCSFHDPPRDGSNRFREVCITSSYLRDTCRIPSTPTGAIGESTSRSATTICNDACSGCGGGGEMTSCSTADSPITDLTVERRLQPTPAPSEVALMFDSIDRRRIT
eukprot:2940066-Rhodomonas_salina.1